MCRLTRGTAGMFAMVVLAWSALASAQPGRPGWLRACWRALGTCQGNLSTCDGDLSTCTADLSATSSELATCTDEAAVCDADLQTCATDLSTASADLAACTEQAATCDAELQTCGSDLASTQAVLAVCEDDLDGCDAELGVCDADLADCQTALGTTSSALDQCQRSLSECQAERTACSSDLAACQADLDSICPLQAMLQMLANFSEDRLAVGDSLTVAQCGVSANEFEVLVALETPDGEQNGHFLELREWEDDDVSDAGSALYVFRTLPGLSQQLQFTYRLGGLPATFASMLQCHAEAEALGLCSL